MVKAFPVACLAPPLTDKALARYRELAEGASPEVKDAMGVMLRCCEKWWSLPESTAKPTNGPLVRTKDRGDRLIQITPIGEDIMGTEADADSLWSVTPWMHELEGYSNGRDDGILDKLPQGELRDAAFHLLWHCKEITLDREPLTNDKL